MTYDPHCKRCDDMNCNALLPLDAEQAYIDHAGDKPTHGLMRSAWEHSMMVWCKAWDACLHRKVK